MTFKRIIAVCLSFLMMVLAIPTSAFAASNEHIDTPSIILDTGDSEIGIEVYLEEDNLAPFSYNTKTSTYSGRFYHKDTDETIADLKLTATFAYDGSLCNVSSVSATVSNVESGYIVEKSTGTEQISPTYAKAYCYFELYKDGFFSDELRSACNVIIYCNQNGTITKEWNG